MKKIALFIFVCSFILLRPFIIQNGDFWYYGDDQDYFAHATSIAFGQFPSYKNEYLVIDKNYPQSSIGCGLLAVPFVEGFSLIDRLAGSSIVQQRTPENIPKSWAQFGFLFAACFYFSLGCFLLYQGALYCIEERYAFLSVVLTVLAQGIPLYAYRRPMFSHYGEFFLQSLCVYIFLKNLGSHGNKFPRLTWHFLFLGHISAMIFLARYNNIAFALLWPCVFIVMNDPSLKILNYWKKILWWMSGFGGSIVVFKVWPEAYNQHHPYSWIMHFLLRKITLPDLIYRLGHILFGFDWGLVYTAPYILLGLLGAYFLKYPGKKYLIWIIAALIFNLYIVIVWGDQGSWHGYRFLIASAIPLLVFPIAHLMKQMEEHWKKKLTWLWILIAVPPLLSMLCFETNNTTFNLYQAPVDLGETDFTNYLYQFHVWETVLFKPVISLKILGMGGWQYFEYLLTHALQNLGFSSNSYFRNYTEFSVWTLIKVCLIYVIPFALALCFKNPIKVPSKSSWRDLSWLLFIPLSYGLIFILFCINKLPAERIVEPKQALTSVLNHDILHDADYKYLLDMADKETLPNKETLKEFRNYFQLVVDSFPGQFDAYSMLGYCQYYLGNKKEAVKDYQAAMRSNPTYFGNFYNLAVIYFNEGEYSKSSDLIRESLELPMQLTAKAILLSTQIYMLIVDQLPGEYPENIDQYLNNEKQKAVELLHQSTEYLNNTNNPPPPKYFLKLI